mmetsp:Transcript_138307/g.311669  ORF Transcript_138307/g.311669 Transcript_138307/m.311669 type:complete len:213 (-) Transcript_138307:136-774(-)
MLFLFPHHLRQLLLCLTAEDLRIESQLRQPLLLLLTPYITCIHHSGTASLGHIHNANLVGRGPLPLLVPDLLRRLVNGLLLLGLLRLPTISSWGWLGPGHGCPQKVRDGIFRVRLLVPMEPLVHHLPLILQPHVSLPHLHFNDIGDTGSVPPETSAAESHPEQQLGSNAVRLFHFLLGHVILLRLLGLGLGADHESGVHSLGGLRLFIFFFL